MPRTVDLLEPNNLRPRFSVYGVARDVLQDLRGDLSFVRSRWRGLGPLRRRPPDSEDRVFAPAQPLAVAREALQRHKRQATRTAA